MTFEGETILTGAPRICDECRHDALDSLSLTSEAVPAALQTWCGCGPYSRESAYIEHARAQELLVRARAVIASTPDDTVLDALRLLLDEYGASR